MIAFDVRDNLLLDPDRLDALVTGVNLIKRLAAPDNLQGLNTGSFVNVPVMHAASVTSPLHTRVGPGSSSATSFRSLSVRATSVTRAPARENACASKRPSPRPKRSFGIFLCEV